LDRSSAPRRIPHKTPPDRVAEIVKRTIDAFNRRDVDACAALVTADFEWVPALAAIESEIFSGRDGIETYFGSLSDAWGETSPHGEDFRDLRRSLFVVIEIEARGTGSGVPIAGPQTAIFDFRDGNISRIRAHFDHGEALRAAGLAELGVTCRWPV
jgi:ketosteroid isomerase-like protein